MKEKFLTTNHINTDCQTTVGTTNLLFVYLFLINPQGYLPCAKLFMVLDESLILISSDCVFCRLAGLALLYTIGVLFSRLIGKPSLNPATIAGFLLYKKPRGRDLPRGKIVGCGAAFLRRRMLFWFLHALRHYTTPCAIIAFATFSKPAMFAPTT